MSTLTDKQASFLSKLLGERLATLGVATLEEAQDKVHMHHLTKKDAGVVIDRLLSIPTDPDPDMPEIVAKSQRKGKGNRPGICHTCNTMVGADEGFYFLKDGGGWGVHHLANQCNAIEEAKPLQEAEAGIYSVEGEGIILVYLTGNQRLAGKRLDDAGKWQYSPGAVMIVRAMLTAGKARPLSAEEASAHGARFGRCIACSRDLSTEESVSAGYGPTCAANHGWAWG